MRSLRDKQYIESKIAELRQGEELLELQSTINELAAREQVFQAYKNGGNVNPAPASPTHTRSSTPQPHIAQTDMALDSHTKLHLPLDDCQQTREGHCSRDHAMQC